MPDPKWQLIPPDLIDQERFAQAVLAAHEHIYHAQFSNDPMSNPKLGMEIRAYRSLDDWRMLLLLTPWMLSRLIFPLTEPDIQIPDDWQAESRTGADYLVLGPRVSVNILGEPQSAHLNFDVNLGHYLIQPIVLSMLSYASPEAVFEAWNHVIGVRDENMKQARKECVWQKEISRKEFFRRSRNSD